MHEFITREQQDYTMSKIKDFFMQVKFVDLGRQYQDLREEILDAVDEVFKSGWYVLGP